MSRVLTSWKEIAEYCSKSVRTIQRWEQMLDFPVHRPRPHSQVIFAFEEEIDEWIAKTHVVLPEDVQMLQERVRVLQAENEHLLRILTMILQSWLPLSRDNLGNRKGRLSASRRD